MSSLENNNLKTICPICVSDYTKKNKIINCPYCNNDCCVVCFKTYLMSSDTIFPLCMYPVCKKEISLEFIASVTPNIFHNIEYRKKRTLILIKREESVLPTRQYLVQIEQKKQKARLEKKEITSNILILSKKLITLKKKLIDLTRIINGIEEKKEEVIEHKTFIKNCPVSDCRGYLSSQWKCGICDVYVCKDCHVIKNKRDDEEHVCNRELVESIIMINKESKPCPVCGIPICKIDGCDQMWCVTCKTPWSWNTGKVDKGTVHNPHYYQWLRNNGDVVPRAVGDVPCGGVHSILQIRRKWILLNNNKINNNKINNFPDIIEKVHMLSSHIRNVEMLNYPNIRHNIDGNSDLSVLYMMKEIDYSQWNSELQKREKKREKNSDYNQLFNMIYTTINDLLIRIYFSDILQEFIDICSQFYAIRDYANTHLYLISTKYKSITLFIDIDWTIKNSNKKIVK